MEVERYRGFLEEQINNYKQKLSNVKARNKDIKKEIDECTNKIYEIE
jgi:peptidoglycan hydrolase CwlO-like protein